jgi:polyisoprenoid-binding protein YceI
MKNFILLLAISGFLAATSAYATEYGFDKAHTHIGFSVKHILGKVPGDYREFDGSFSFDPKKPEASKVQVTIQSASINTGIEMRDKHLKSGDFFDVDKFPTLTYVSNKVSKVAGSDKKYRVEGDLTLHGVTKPVALDVEYLGADTLMGAKIVGFSATTRIDRRDFGLVWNKTLESGNLLVGNDVDITLDISGMDKASLEKQMKASPKK